MCPNSSSYGAQEPSDDEENGVTKKRERREEW
jgi:hypothetical protein